MLGDIRRHRGAANINSVANTRKKNEAAVMMANLYRAADSASRAAVLHASSGRRVSRVKL